MRFWAFVGWVVVAVLGGRVPLRAQGCDTLHTPLEADSLLLPLTGSVHPDSVRGVIQRLQAFETRYYATDSLQAARAWIRQEFQRRGADTVFEQTFTYNGTSQANVIARKRGLCPDSLRIVLGAHYDSYAWSGASTWAPGADDNASGVALLLEVLRVLRDVPLKRTVEFVAFAAEEVGLVGSGVYAQQAAASGDTFLFYLNADMIGGDADRVNDSIIVEVDQGNQQAANDGPSQAWGDSLARAYERYTPLGVSFGPIYASDYMPLEAEGYVTLGVFEYHWNSAYHSGDDVVDSMDVGYTAEVIRGVVALVVSAAGLDRSTLRREEKIPAGVRVVFRGAVIRWDHAVRVVVVDPSGRQRVMRSPVRHLSTAGWPSGVYTLLYRENDRAPLRGVRVVVW